MNIKFIRKDVLDKQEFILLSKSYQTFIFFGCGSVWDWDLGRWRFVAARERALVVARMGRPRGRTQGWSQIWKKNKIFSFFGLFRKFTLFETSRNQASPLKIIAVSRRFDSTINKSQ